MDFQELLVTIAKILDELAIPYVVTGGYAVSIWGRLRATFDLDIVVDLFPAKIPLVKIALQKISAASYLDEDTMREAVSAGKEFNYIHGESGIKVDFFVKGKDAIAKQELERRQPVEVLDYRVYFVSPEDLILAKLRWYQISHSDRQLEDIASVIKIQKKLDWKYLRKWVKLQETEAVLKSVIKKKQ